VLPVGTGLGVALGNPTGLWWVAPPGGCTVTVALAGGAGGGSTTGTGGQGAAFTVAVFLNDGATLGVTSGGFVLNGAPFFNVGGEMLFSRVAPQAWPATLRAMMAGGLTTVSAYVIMIHSNEVEGVYDWSGARNLTAFVLAARDAGRGRARAPLALTPPPRPRVDPEEAQIREENKWCEES
jgi:hypothetical protein